MLKKRMLGVIAFAMAIAILLPGLALATPRGLTYSVSDVEAYIGFDQHLFLVGKDDPQSSEAVAQIVYADATAVYYRTASADNGGKLLKYPLDGSAPSQLAEGVLDDVRYWNGYFYYLEAERPTQLMRVADQAAPQELLGVDAPGGQLGITLDGLCYAYADGTGTIVTQLYQEGENSFASAGFTYDENYDNFSNFETTMGTDGFKIHLNGSDEWIVLDQNVEAVTAMNNKLYYMKAADDGKQVYEYDSQTKESKQLSVLGNDFDAQLVGSKGYLYVISGDQKINRIDAGNGAVQLISGVDSLGPGVPLLQLVDDMLLVYDAADQSSTPVYKGALQLGEAQIPEDENDGDELPEDGDEPQATEAPTKDEDDDQNQQTTDQGNDGYSFLQSGDKGEKVRKLQQRLKDLGYPAGSADGVFGGQTEAAVRLFQKAIGYDQTGTAGPKMQARLFASKAPKYKADDSSSQYTALKPGDKGEKVKKLQRRLKELGYFNGDISGNYLTKTTDAVKKFQKAIGYDQTGAAGPKMQARLFASNAPKYKGESSSDHETLTPGDTGERVKKLQRRLKELGYFDGDIGGNYLTKTTAAVKKFQKAIGFEETGTAGPKMQARLFADDAPWA